MDHQQALVRFVYLTLAYLIMQAIINLLRFYGPGWCGVRPTKSEVLGKTVFYLGLATMAIGFLSEVS